MILTSDEVANLETALGILQATMAKLLVGATSTLDSGLFHGIATVPVERCSYFPLLISYKGSEELVKVDVPGDIAPGKPFTVIACRVDRYTPIWGD